MDKLKLGYIVLLPYIQLQLECRLVVKSRRRVSPLQAALLQLIDFSSILYP